MKLTGFESNKINSEMVNHPSHYNLPNRKECIDEIHEIDDYINKLYGLTEEESLYIKNFAFRYRIGGGVENESN